MADNDIDVRFGATTSDLEHGAERVKDKLDAIKEAADKITESGKRLLEAFGIAFTVEKIGEFIASMAEAGDRTERFSQSLGVSAERVGELEFIAKATGGTIDGMALSLERMTLNIQRSTSSAFSPASLALQKLGLSAKDLIGLGVDDQLYKIATAASKFNSDIQLSNVLMSIGGKSMANLMPVIGQGAAGLDHLRDAAKAAGASMSGPMAAAFAETNLKLLSMWTALNDLGRGVFSVLKPAIDLIVDSLTSFFRKLDRETIRDFAIVLTDKLGGAVIWLVGAFYTLGSSIDEILEKIKRVLLGAAIGGGLGMLGGPGTALAGVAIGGGIVAAWDEFTAGFKQGADKAGADVDAKRAAIVAKVTAMMEAIKAAIKGGGEGKEHAGPEKENIGALDFDAQQRIQVQVASIEGEIRVMQEGLKRKAMLYQEDAATFQITQQQRVQMTAQAVNEEYQLHRDALGRELLAYKDMPKERQAVLEKIKELEQTNQTEITRLNAEAVRDRLQQIQSYLGQLQSSFNGQLRGLLAGTVNFAQAMRTVFQDMIIFIIEQIEKMVFNWIAGQLAVTSGQKATAAAGEATQAAAFAASVPIATARVNQNLAILYAGLAAFYAELGPGAPAAAAAETAEVGATALGMMVVPGAEQGAWDTSAGLWQLHEGETVLPQPAAQAFRDMASGNGPGGGGGTTINIDFTHNGGGPLTRETIRQYGRDLATEVARQFNDNRTLRPSY